MVRLFNNRAGKHSDNRMPWVILVSTLVKGIIGTGLLAVLSIAGPQNIWAAPAGYSLYYMPGAEADMRLFFEEAANDRTLGNVGGVVDGLYSIIGLSVWADNTRIYIDHWEDGYEIDLDNPDATADEVLPVKNNGDVIRLISQDVPSLLSQRSDPGDPAPITDCTCRTPGCATPGVTPVAGCYYDGRDKIYVAGGSVSISRAVSPEQVCRDVDSDGACTGADTNIQPAGAVPGDNASATVQATDAEVYPVRPQLTTYILPFGEDLAPAPAGLTDFTRVFVLIQATADNTVVRVDFDANGTFDAIDTDRDGDCNGVNEGASVTLNEGETLYLSNASDGNGGSACGSATALNTRTLIQSTETIQVTYLTSDPSHVYDSNSYAAFPTGFWDNEYYGPVDGAAGTDYTEIYMYNPQDYLIYVDYELTGASGTISIPANSMASFRTATGTNIPDGSAIYAKSRNGDPFWAVSMIDTEDATGAYDWGYSLIPGYLAADEYVFGYAPSGIPITVGTTDAYSGIYITSTQDNNIVFLDYDGDGPRAPVQYTVNRLQTLYLYDTVDGDMTGAFLYSAAPFVAAFGENPDTAPTQTPAIDMGYTTLPGSTDWIELVLDVTKATDPVIVGTGTGQTTKYTIVVTTDEFDVENIRVIDTLATGWKYCDGSTVPSCAVPVVTFPDGSTSSDTPIINVYNVIDGRLDINNDTFVNGSDDGTFDDYTVIDGYLDINNDGAITAADDASGIGTNGFTVYNGGIDTNASGTITTTDDLPGFTGKNLLWNSTRWTGGRLDMAPNQTLTIEYYAYTSGTHTAGLVTQTPVRAIGQRDVGTPTVTQTFEARDSVFNLYTTNLMTIAKSSPTVTIAYPGDTIPYTVTVGNPAGRPTLTNISVLDALPDGVTYVTGTGRVAGALNVADTFSARVYNNNNGSVYWAGDWVETDGGGGGATGGYVQIPAGDPRLRLGAAGGGNADVYRQVNLAGASSATLTLNYGTNGQVDNGEWAYVELATSLAGPWTTALSFQNDVAWPTALNYAIPANLRSATTYLRIRITGYDNDPEYLYIDNVNIAFPDRNTAAPPSMIDSGEGFSLTAGQNLTLTFSGLVDRPLDTAITELTNEICATSTEIPLPLCATTTDPVVIPGDQSASVGDLVWLDDGDGIWEVGEPGIANVEVTLKDKLGTPLQTMLTNSNGYYLFTDVAPDSGYYVEVTGGLPAGLTQTTDSRTDDRTNSFTLLTTNDYEDGFASQAYNLSTGTINWAASPWTETNDNGLPATGNILITVAGTRELQINNNNAGLDNMIQRTVSLPGNITSAIVSFDYRTTGGVDAADSLIFEISTDGGTIWTTLQDFTSIAGAAPGTAAFNIMSYATNNTILRFRTNGASYTDTAANESFLVDNFDVTYQTLSTTEYLNADLGYRPATGTAIIGDLVWSDAINYGVRDAGEPGLAGVTVRLYNDNNANGVIDGGDTVREETVTDADGSYLFTNVPASDDYIVWVDQTDLSAYTITTPLSGIFAFLNVPAGSRFLNADFGFRQTAPGMTFTITDRVWFDNGGGGGTADNGTQDGSEGGISGVTVVLLDDSLNVIATTTTDASGNFSFIGVPGGVRYSWQVTDQANILTSYYGTTDPARTRLYQMPSNLTGNLDYRPTPHFGYNISRSLGDTVFNDNGDGGGTAADGIQNGTEPGIVGVTLVLYRDADSDNVFEPGGQDGAPVGTFVITDDYGRYLFAGLADGWYWVTIDNTQVALTGYTLTSPDDSGVAGHQQRQQISGGASSLDADFGYRAANPGRLRGTIWEDADLDGVIDGTETRLANVTVDLIRGGVVIATDVTDSSGNYAFNGLVTAAAPGIAYTVRVTDTSSVLSGYQTTYERTEGTAGFFNSQENESLTPNENVDNINFGYFKPNPTMAVISYFKVVMENGATAAEWETVSQIGTLGFTLMRRDGSGNALPVTNRPIPALVYPHGGVYRCIDTGVTVGGTFTYELRELEASGTTRPHGPYTVTVNPDSGSSRAASFDNDLFRLGYSRTPRDIYQPVEPAIAAGASKEGSPDDLSRTLHAIHRPRESAIASDADFLGALFRKDRSRTSPETRSLRAIYQPDELNDGSWVIPPVAAIQPAAAAVNELTGIRDVKIRVTESGLYRVTAAALAAALNVSEEDVIDVIAGRLIRLTSQGMTVAYYPAEDNSGIYFYGERISSIYTDHNVYWLKLMPGTGTGDLDGDGLVDRDDLTIGMAVMNGLPAEDLRPDFAGSDADVNANGKVDMTDLAYIRNALAGVMRTTSGDLPATTGEDQSFAAAAHFEEETFYKTDAPIEVEDFWFWDFYTLGLPAFGAAFGLDPFIVEVPEVAPGSDHTAELTVNFHGFSIHPHQARVTLNAGTGKALVLGVVDWSGYDPVSQAFSFNQEKLNNGVNTVKIESLKTDDSFGVDSFDLTYQKTYTAAADTLRFTADGHNVITVSGFSDPDILLFDLTDPAEPKRVANAAVDAANNRITVTPPAADTPYLAALLSAAGTPELLADAPSDLRNPANSADYLVITADELSDGAQALADYRRTKGKTPLVAKLSDVFDEFSDGIYDPYAIREFIACALDQWRLSPQDVVLVGDGTFDYRESLEVFSIEVLNLMPVVMIDTPYGIYASDKLYGDTDGDGLAEVAIGRIPAKSNAEVSGYVAKVIAYESGVPAPRNHVLMLADNPDDAVANNFPADSDAVGALADGFTVDKVYYPGRNPLTAEQMRNDFAAAVNSGEWLVNYIGHGGYDVMSNFFNTTPAHLNLLTNSQYPIYAGMTCLLGDYSYPWMDTLSEEMVLKTGGGMIAAWSPTGLSINSEAVKMNKELFTALFDEKVGTLGRAVNRALERYQSSGVLEYPYMMDIYSLLGDPALEIQ